jgi:dihydroorotase
MQEFTSTVAQDIYGKLPTSSRKKVKLKRKDFKIPDRFFIKGDTLGTKDIGVIPMGANEIVTWTIDTINDKVVEITNQGVQYKMAA